MNRFALVCFALAGCWTSSQPETQKPVPASDVTVELAAVTLADDCPDPVVETQRNAKPTPGAVAPTPPADRCAGPDCGSLRARCDQTSMQLAFHSSAGTKPTQVSVKKVELLDAEGNVLGQLAARNPTRWGTDTYVRWDQTLGPEQTLQASYALASPNYEAVGGRGNAEGKTFQLRVTIAVGNSERVVEKQSISPVVLEPDVPVT